MKRHLPTFYIPAAGLLKVHIYLTNFLALAGNSGSALLSDVSVCVLAAATAVKILAECHLHQGSSSLSSADSFFFFSRQTTGV